MSEQDLKISVEAKGAAEAQQELRAVNAEVEKVAGATGKAAKSTGDQATENVKLDASWRQIVGVLRFINPELAQYADGLLKSGKLAEVVAGQVGGLGGTLTGLFDKLKAAGTGTWALVGALGAAGVSLYMLKMSWDSVQKSIAEARAEQEKFIESQNRMQAGRLDTEDAVRGVAQRQRETVTVDEVRRAASQARRLMERGISEGTAVEVTGGLAGPDLAEGGALGSIDDLETYARAVEQGLAKAPDPRRTRETRTKRARRAIDGRAGEEIAADAELERQVERERAAAAKKELERGQLLTSPIGIQEFSTGGGTEYLERMIKELRGDEFTDEDRRLLARLVQLYETLRSDGKSEDAAQSFVMDYAEGPLAEWLPGTSHGSQKMAADAAALHASIRAQIWRRTSGGEHGDARATPQWPPTGPNALMEFMSGAAGPGTGVAMGRNFRGAALGDGGESDDRLLMILAKFDAAANLMLKAMQAQAMAANHTVGVTPLVNAGTYTGMDYVKDMEEG